MNRKELNLILQTGEGYLIEFKESPVNLDREMVSFANGSGGRIFIGITDKGEIQGVHITNKLKSQVQDIANNCEPPVKIKLEESGNILVVHVENGGNKPYSCASGFYNRIGPNAQKMKRAQIIEFFQSEEKIRFDELFNSRFNYKKEFDPNKFEHYLKSAGISPVLNKSAILQNLGAAEVRNGQVVLNNTGILFFSRNLNDFYRHTVVTCALYKGTSKVNVLDRKDYNGDIISNIDNAMIFLKQHIPVRYEFDGAPERKEYPSIPPEALREGVINAVCHRNYFEKGANVMVEMFDDRVEISSPGGLARGLAEKDFGKKSVQRNPNIASLLHRIHYIEKMGTGIQRMQNTMREAKNKPVIFEFTSFVTAVFKSFSGTEPKETGATKGGVTPAIESMVELIALIQNNPKITIPEIARRLNKSKRTIERIVAELQQKKKLTRTGSARGGVWEISIDES